MPCRPNPAATLLVFERSAVQSSESFVNRKLLLSDRVSVHVIIMCMQQR